ncbi:MAG: hypothetical protein KAG20_03380 [Cocleimonas sp.]|nr:hypothetical protein [Cocleimonas sp.]
MLQVILYIVVGILLGISFSLLVVNVISSKELKRTQQMAMFKIYLEVLMKKRDKSYQYSTETRRIINAAHLSQLSK